MIQPPNVQTGTPEEIAYILLKTIEHRGDNPITDKKELLNTYVDCIKAVKGVRPIDV